MNRRQITNAGAFILAAPLYIPALILAFVGKLLLRLCQWGASAIKIGIHKGWHAL